MEKIFLLSIFSTFLLAGCSLPGMTQPVVTHPIQVQPAPVPVAPEQPTEPKACTMEAKLCPDGSYVSRTGPNCEFAKCPGETQTSCTCPK